MELSWGPSKVLQPFTAAYSTPKNSPGARGWHLSFPILPAWNVNFHSQISQIKWNVCVTRQDWYPPTVASRLSIKQLLCQYLSQVSSITSTMDHLLSLCKLLSWTLWSPCGIDIHYAVATTEVPYLIRCTLWSTVLNRSSINITTLHILVIWLVSSTFIRAD